MIIDRKLQNQLLEALKISYPAPGISARIAASLRVEHHQLCSNAAYLVEHGLVRGDIRLASDGSNQVRPAALTITAEGLDFIEEDGGLSAVLGVVTVKLHADTIRDLILAQIEAAEVESSVKEQLKVSVKSLPAKGLEAVVTRLAQEGLTRLPNAMQWLQTAISAAQSSGS